MRLTAAMVNRARPVPVGFNKGDIVRLRPATSPREGWRRTTPGERQGWYDKLHEEVRAGRDQPYDSAGETRLAPQDAYVPMHRDRTYEVVRGRVNAPYGYSSMKGCCLIQDMLTGEQFFCKRAALELA